MNQWIQVNLRRRHARTPGESVGIRVWASDNQDAIAKANRIIDYRKWEPESAGPTQVRTG